MKGLLLIFRKTGSVAIVPSDIATRSRVTGPFINVLKQVPVNSFQVLSVDSARFVTPLF